jgi:hypothetical protein
VTNAKIFYKTSLLSVFIAVIYNSQSNNSYNLDGTTLAFLIFANLYVNSYLRVIVHQHLMNLIN